MAKVEKTPEELAEEKRVESVKRRLKTAIRKTKGDRTTESGRACVDAALRLLELGDMGEARQFLKLSLSMDKQTNDIRLKEALDQLEAKKATAKEFSKVRRGAKPKLSAVE